VFLGRSFRLEGAEIPSFARLGILSRSGGFRTRLTTNRSCPALIAGPSLYVTHVYQRRASSLLAGNQFAQGNKSDSAGHGSPLFHHCRGLWEINRYRDSPFPARMPRESRRQLVPLLLQEVLVQ
jgi:hypothetical protein